MLQQEMSPLFGALCPYAGYEYEHVHLYSHRMLCQISVQYLTFTHATAQNFHSPMLNLAYLGSAQRTRLLDIRFKALNAEMNVQ